MSRLNIGLQKSKVQQFASGAFQFKRATDLLYVPQFTCPILFLFIKFNLLVAKLFIPREATLSLDHIGSFQRSAAVGRSNYNYSHFILSKSSEHFVSVVRLGLIKSEVNHTNNMSKITVLSFIMFVLFYYTNKVL